MQWWKSKLAEVMAWGIEWPSFRLGHSQHSATEGATTNIKVYLRLPTFIEMPAHRLSGPHASINNLFHIRQPQDQYETTFVLFYFKYNNAVRSIMGLVFTCVMPDLTLSKLFVYSRMTFRHAFTLTNKQWYTTSMLFRHHTRTIWLVLGVLRPGNISGQIRMGADLLQCALTVTL